MYHLVCNECGKVFAEEDADVIEERHTEVQPVGVERFMACPYCGGTSCDDAAYCERCNDPVRYESLVGGLYCKDCFDSFLADLFHLREYARENADDFAEWMYEKSRGKHGKQG